MRKPINRAEELASGYWSATLTESEEQELRDILNSKTNLSDELQALKAMFEGFEALATEHETPTKKRKPRIIEMIISFSAAAAVLAIGIITHFGTTPTPEAEIYCYINGEPITDIDIALEQTKYLEPLSNLAETINTIEEIMLN